MNGHHLTADLSGCPSAAAPMTEPAVWKGLCLDAVCAAAPTTVAERFRRFRHDKRSGGAAQPVRITGDALLAESHPAVRQSLQRDRPGSERSAR